MNSRMNAIEAVWYAVTGGKFLLVLDDPDARPGVRSARVVDDEGKVIGHAYDYIYGGSGFSVWAGNYAGHVPMGQIELLTCMPTKEGVREHLKPGSVL